MPFGQHLLFHTKLRENSDIPFGWKQDMDKFLVVVFATIGMLVWIAGWICFLLIGADNILQQTQRTLLITPTEIPWLQDPIATLRMSINSREKVPFIFWTVLPFVVIVAMLLSWSIVPNTGISYSVLIIAIVLLSVTELLTEATLQERVFRSVAYVFLILAMVFFVLALGGQGKFVETFAANFATEFSMLTLTFLFLDELNQWREEANQRRIGESLAAERKRNIIQQMASRSNDYALEAMRVAQEHRWLFDGSLRGAELRYANLRDAILSNANLEGIILERANLQNARLERANLKEANLSMSALQDSALWEANLEAALLWGTNLQRAELHYANLCGCDLRNANLSDADLDGADLRNATLFFSNLQGANMEHTDMRGADLRNAKLLATNFKGSLLEGASFRRAKYNNATKWPEGFTPPPDAINIGEE